MNEIEIKRILSCTQNCHICANDELTFYSEFPSHYIVNTEQRDGNSGEHWLCLIFDKIDEQIICYFFDSLAAYPEVICPQIIQFCRQNAQIIHFNGKRIQSPYNSTCGLYACFFVLNYHTKFNFKNFLLRFSTSERKNDLDMLEIFLNFLRIDFDQSKIASNMMCKSIKANLQKRSLGTNSREIL